MHKLSRAGKEIVSQNSRSAARSVRGLLTLIAGFWFAIGPSPPAPVNRGHGRPDTNLCRMTMCFAGLPDSAAYASGRKIVISSPQVPGLLEAAPGHLKIAVAVRESAAWRQWSEQHATEAAGTADDRSGRLKTRGKGPEQAYLCIIACRNRSAAGDCWGWLDDEGEDIVKDLVDQGSAGAGSIKTVGIRLLDFDDKGGGRGLLSESCLLEEEMDGDRCLFLSDPEGLRLLRFGTARIDDDEDSRPSSEY